MHSMPQMFKMPSGAEACGGTLFGSPVGMTDLSGA